MSDLTVSFEIFPPRSPTAWDNLHKAVRRLEAYRPAFVSVTYGAGGTTRAPTLEAVSWLAGETRLPAAGHLTCVGAAREETDAVVRAYRQAGAQQVVALRGDPPEGAGAPYRPHPEGYQSTAELVAAIRAIHPFEVSVSAYPEKHPQSRDMDADLDVLAEKVEAGACRAITQFFFDNEDFFRYRDLVAARGIDVNLVPGILPIGSFQQLTRFAEKCGARIPESLHRCFAGLEDEPETHRLVAAAVAAEQIDDLASNGVREFHFYTLNRAELTIACCRILGLTPKPKADRAPEKSDASGADDCEERAGAAA